MAKVLHSIRQAVPDLSVRALFRDRAKADALATVFPNVQVVEGTLDDVALIEEEAKKADIILNLANTKHLESVQAIHKALKGRETSGKPSYWIQISGASLLAAAELADSKRVPGSSSDVVFDDLDVSTIHSTIRQHPSRAVDNYILRIAAEEPHINTALVIPPIIYGPGQGPSNQRSVQIPELAKATLQRRRGLQVGEGLSRWGNVHIHDLGDLFTLLVKAALDDGSKSDDIWNLNGFYLTSIGELSFAEISGKVAEHAASKGWVSNQEVEKFSGEDSDRLLPHGSVLYGTNARGKSRRGPEVLGWKPQHGSRGLEAEIIRAVEEEAKALKLLTAPNGHSWEQPTGLFINNQFTPASGQTIVSIDPATQEPISTVHAAGVEDVDRAVKAAHAAFHSHEWKTTSATTRGILMAKLADLIEANKELFATIDAWDNGKPYMEALNNDLVEAVGVIRYYSGWADKVSGQTISVPNKFAYTIRQPVGVIAQIIPWNYPLAMATWKLGPALACGNTVVLKAAEQTPLSILVLGKLVCEAGFPPGVVNFINGYGQDAGSALVSHPLVDKVAFTGSTATASQIMTLAARTLKNITLETGGKSPLIVFDDCDFEQAIRWSHLGIMSNQGQICTATSRILVQRETYDRFVGAFVEEVKRTSKVGDQWDPETYQGPQVSKQQYDRIISYLEQGRREGTAAIGGDKIIIGDGKGYYVAPTVFVNVGDDSKLWREEIFGPVVVIRPFDEEADAVRMANDSIYGLGAAIFTKDLMRAHRVAASIESGMVWVNSSQDCDPRVPFGGVKQSGMGRELGEAGLEAYTQIKAVHSYKANGTLNSIDLRGRGSGRQTGASAAGPGDGVTLAVVASELGQDAGVVEGGVEVIAAELLALLEAARDAGAAEGAQAVVGVADGRGGALLAGQLDGEGAALDGVDEDVAGLEVGVRAPGAEELDDTAALGGIVLGVDVDPGDLADTGTGGVGGNGAEVEDAQAGAIVGLVYEVVDDVLVVVDGLDLGLVGAGLLGVLEVTDVPDAGHLLAFLACLQRNQRIFSDLQGNGVALGGGAVATLLVELVVEDQELLVVDVEDPALVGVGGTLVGDTGDDVGDVGLVGHVVDGEGVLVIAVADVTALVALVGSAVDQALGIVDVAIVLRRDGVGRVGEVEEVEAGAADRVVAGLSTDGGEVAELLVDNNVVGTADRQQLAGPGGEVVLSELNRAGRVNVEQLLQVEDLDAVADGLGADDGVVLVGADLAPLRGQRVGGQTAEIAHLAVLADLHESCALILANCNEFAAVGGVGQEVVEVDVVATEGVVAVARDGLDPAIDTLGEAELWVQVRVEQSKLTGLGPVVLRGVLVLVVAAPLARSRRALSYQLVLHDLLVNDAGVVKLGGNLSIGLDLLAGDGSGQQGEGAQVGLGVDHVDEGERGSEDEVDSMNSRSLTRIGTALGGDHSPLILKSRRFVPSTRHLQQQYPGCQAMACSAVPTP
ncbi:aldehyde dehydrogenase [Paramyrothecium foliicola]|nr:aldehyde dehydrogenase [Paramyrothecium foliicola]